MTKKRQEVDEPTPADIETRETPTTEPQPSETPAEPKKEEPVTSPSATPPVSDAQKEDQDEEQNPSSTAKKLLEPFNELLNDKNKRAAPKIREVLTALHEQGLTLLANDQYYAVRKELAARLDVTPQLVEKSAKEVLKVQDEDNSDDPQFPDAPTGPRAQNPAGTAPITPAAGSNNGASGGAPFGGSGLFTATGPNGENVEAVEMMAWNKKNVGRVVAMPINLLAVLSEASLPLTKAERDVLGDSFLQIFKDLLPTTQKTGSFLVAMSAMEMILLPRIIAVIKARKKDADVEKIREELRKKIQELNEDAEK